MPGWVYLVLVGLEVPALVALVDWSERPAHMFEGGEADRRAWRTWLIIAAATAWLAGLGNIIVLGYHSNVVRRGTPLGRG